MGHRRGDGYVMTDSMACCERSAMVSRWENEGLQTIAPSTERVEKTVAETIEEGSLVFVADGQDGVGSVRRLLPDEESLVIYIENAGDFVIPVEAVRAVHSGKVILDLDRLSRPVLEAIAHARRSEYPH
ncbi:hypothetical protein [Dyella sp. 20L07]|uniref:hypothetical protein n=1 Tax=Dyella sp. 20L07 TaxID=3384240 RepID=UPI003D2A4CC5